MRTACLFPVYLAHWSSAPVPLTAISWEITGVASRQRYHVRVLILVHTIRLQCVRRDLTEGTLGGSIISLIAAAVMVFLFLAELAAFMQTTTHTSVVIDRSTDGDLLKLNFNISFPRLSCDFASVDVSDALGMVRSSYHFPLACAAWSPETEKEGNSRVVSSSHIVVCFPHSSHTFDPSPPSPSSRCPFPLPCHASQNRYNLTKTVRKRPITATGQVLGDYHFDRGDIKHEARGAPHRITRVDTFAALQPVLSPRFRRFDPLRRDNAPMRPRFACDVCLLPLTCRSLVPTRP